LNEKLLLEQARNGEAAAFRNLVEQNKKKIYYLALNLTGNHNDAQDLSQEVFIKAFHGLNKFRGEAGFSSWLYKIAVNTNINQSRQKMIKAMKQSVDVNNLENLYQAKDKQNDPEKHLNSIFIKEHIDKALEKLSMKERTVFVLKHYEDMSLATIAEIMSVKIGTVKSTLFRAIKKLRKELSFYIQDFGEI